jgi:hypothetical protein
MSSNNKNQKRSPCKRPKRLFEIFDESTPTTTTTHTNTNNTTNTAVAAANVTAPTSSDLPLSVVAAEPVNPTEAVANWPSIIQDAESAVSEDDIDAPLLGEKHLPASPAAAVTSDDDAKISELSSDDEEIAITRAAEEQLAAASFESLFAMGFDGEKVLLSLLAARGDENVAVEYLLNGIPQEESEEVDLGDPGGTPDQDNTKDGCDDDKELDQDQRERLVVLRTRSKGFNEEEIAEILHVFRQDRMAALDLEFDGPSSARAAALARRNLTNATLPPLLPTLTPHLSATRHALMSRSDTLCLCDSTRTPDPASRSRLPNSEYISPFTNGYVTISPPIDAHLTNQPTINKSLKRPLDTSSDTAGPCKKRKKRPRAPAPPRYKGLTREEYMERRFGEDWEDEAP